MDNANIPLLASTRRRRVGENHIPSGAPRTGASLFAGVLKLPARYVGNTTGVAFSVPQWNVRWKQMPTREVKSGMTAQHDKCQVANTVERA
jgi:hypothetical protein